MQIIETNYNWSSALQNRSLTKYIVLHHAGATTVTAKSIHDYHLSKGWSGIGYHFFITKKGDIYRGRPINTIGAHVSGQNSLSIGICAEGDYSSHDKVMPTEQKKAIAELLSDLKLKYPSALIVGHKEIGNSLCPGAYYPLEELKNYTSILKGDNVKQININCQCINYEFLEDVPEDYRDTVKKFIDKGIVKGTGENKLNLSEDICRMLCYLDRMGLLM